MVTATFTELLPPWVGIVVAQLGRRGPGHRCVARAPARTRRRRAAARGRASGRDHRGQGPAVPPARSARPGRRAPARGDPGPSARAAGTAPASGPDAVRRSGDRQVRLVAPMTSRTSCTVPHRTTTRGWSASRPPSTRWRGRSADHDRPAGATRRTCRAARGARRGGQGRRRAGRGRHRPGDRSARAAVTSCSRACREPRRLSWCVRWPPRSTSSRGGSSSPPT